MLHQARKKLKKQYIHLKGKQIEKLKKSGFEITVIIFADALRAKILVTEATFLDEGYSIKHAREHGQTHVLEIMEHAQWIWSKAVLLTHFLSRYNIEDIHQAVSKLQARVSEKI
ncbi:hypothetical protein SLA2020_194130 [Shorea laevis]